MERGTVQGGENGMASAGNDTEGAPCARHPLRAVVVDLDAAPFPGTSTGGSGYQSGAALVLYEDEAEGLRALERAGLLLVIVTAAPKEQAEQVVAAAGIHPLVLSDCADGTSSGSVLGAAARRAEALAHKYVKGLANYGELCVVATHPIDRELMLEAGCALALRGAGAIACAGADAVFPPREEGGLVAALAHVRAKLR